MRTLFTVLLSGFLLFLPERKKNYETQNSRLKIKITNIKKLKGNLMVAVFDAESKFLNDYSLAKRRKVSANEHVLVFENLPKGTYAVSIFHDINSNSKLDSNFLGIPKEPYGFSNNPSTLFGPPSFERAAFKIDMDTKTITIEL